MGPDDGSSHGDRLSGARIGRVSLRVGDLDETTAFYRDVIGLAVLDRGDDGVVLGVDGTGLDAAATPLLVLRHAPDDADRRRTDAGLFHTAFRVPGRAALGEALARVRDGWRLDGASDHRVSEALYLSDPEGNGVEIYRDRPREEWPIEGDGSVAMTTEPIDLDAVSAAARGDETENTDRVRPGTDVGHVHLEVTSLAAFESVYVDGLGFEMRQAAPDVRFVAADGYHHHVGANAWQGRTTPASGRGLDWFEVVIPDDGSLEAVRERLDAAASETTGEAAFAVDDVDDGIAVTDADGIEVRVRTDVK